MIKEVKSVDISYINSLLHAKKDKKDDCEWDPEKHDGEACPHHQSGEANFKHEQPKKKAKTKEQLEKEAFDKMNEETKKVNQVNANIKAKQEYAKLTTPQSDVGKGITKTGEAVSTLGKQVGDAPFAKSGHKEYAKYEDLNDEELRRKINRLKNEREYSDLKGDTKYIKSGKDKAREILQTAGALLGIVGTVVTIIATVKGLRKPRNDVAQSEDLDSENSLYLEHYGTKGMKWGVRNEKEYEPKSRNSNNDANEEEQKNKIKKVAIVSTLAAGSAALLAMGIAIKRRNSTIKNQNNLLEKSSSALKRQHEEYNKTADELLKMERSRNYYKSRAASIRVKGSGIKGANFNIGSITALTQINHSDSNDSLMHYGVKGMKWGVRNEQDYDGYPSNYRKPNFELSKHELKVRDREAKKEWLREEEMAKRKEYRKERTMAEGSLAIKKTLRLFGSLALGPLAKPLMGNNAMSPKEIFKAIKSGSRLNTSRHDARQYEKEVQKEMNLDKYKNYNKKRKL